MDEAENYLTHILTGLTSRHEDIRVAKSADEMGVLLTVSLAKEDMGKVIGREGSMAQAIRRIMRAYGRSRNQYINLKIVDENGNEKPQ